MTKEEAVCLYGIRDGIGTKGSNVDENSLMITIETIMKMEKNLEAE